MNVSIHLLLLVACVAKPYLPIPTEQQVEYMERGMVGFIHFGVNTYTGKEWGDGTEDPKIFNPEKLNTTQWVEAMKWMGAESIIMVTKHLDGFMLYPNPYTRHSVASSSWRDGKGDVVREFVQSCREQQIVPAYYLSPLDKHYNNKDWDPTYNKFYLQTMAYLLENYGPITEVWFDGANLYPNMTSIYAWHAWVDTLKKIQPLAIAGGCGAYDNSPDCGPDTTWGETESGLGKEELWNHHKPSMQFPELGPLVFAPYFLDVSIRPGWFYHEHEKPKTLKELIHIYFRSVGLGYQLQINVPPNKDGLFDKEDVDRMREFGDYIRDVFGKDEALKAYTTESSSHEIGHHSDNVLSPDKLRYWTPSKNATNGSITLLFKKEVTFNVVMLQEFIRHGQKIAHHSFSIQREGKWEKILKGTTIGVKRMHVLKSSVSTSGVRLEIEDTWNDYVPEVTRIGLFNSMYV